ncbi:MAG: 2-dehydro-3-deoxygalactonokinase [Pseudomonadota bacterium]
MSRLDWIAVDWGTTHLRAWGMGAGGVVFQTRGDQGMAQVRPGGFEEALLALVGDWIAHPTPVVACGMVGARQGWVETPYRCVPCAPVTALTQAPTQDARLRVFVTAGVQQTNPADVMRGEETQIAGLVAERETLSGVVCLPGTHSKWVQMEAGEIFHFATFLTGELFALLASASVLRHGIADDGADMQAFLEAVDTALGTPERVAAKLFGLRAEGLISGLDPVTARARLSGLLIGLELAGAKPYWLGQEVTLVGDGALIDLYSAALGQLGLVPNRRSGEAAVLAGLAAANRSLMDTAR